MHDLFDIVGLSRSARPLEVRRACARVVRRTHPDFQREGAARDARWAALMRPVRRDVAVDFVDMAAVVDNMQASFFSGAST